jgi:hypothetical protein
MSAVFLSLSLQDWIKLAILLLPVLTMGLTLLSRSAYIAKSAAYSEIVQIALHITAQIETTLQANPLATRPQLIADGIAELRAAAAPAFTRLGLDPRLTELELALLFQRLSSFVPAKIAAGINDVLGSGTIPGASSLTSIKRASSDMLYVRKVGASNYPARPDRNLR